MTGRAGSGCVLCERAGRLRYVKGPARYWECPSCGLLYQDPLPAREEMRKFAEGEYAGGVYQEYVRARELKYATFRERLALLRTRLPTGRLLDVGCACGYLLDVALEAGYDAYGIEFATAAAAQAPERVRPRITVGDADSAGRVALGTFDVITAFDILEHLHDPLRFLADLRVVLRRGGLLMLTTPDSRHPLRFLMRARWPMLQPLQHTFLFSRRSMGLALERAGFQVAAIRSATKSLTLDYLAGQIAEHNPAVHRVYRRVAPAIPRALRHRVFRVHIGEMLVVAVNPA